MRSIDIDLQIREVCCTWHGPDNVCSLDAGHDGRCEPTTSGSASREVFAKGLRLAEAGGPCFACGRGYGDLDGIAHCRVMGCPACCVCGAELPGVKGVPPTWPEPPVWRFPWLSGKISV